MTGTNGDERKPAVPVYEAEIIDEDELSGKDVVGRGTGEAAVPVKKTETLSYRLGKMAGAVAAFLGIVSEVAGAFRTNKRSAGAGRGAGGGGGGRGRGRKNGSGMGRGKGRGRRKRNVCQ